MVQHVLKYHQIIKSNLNYYKYLVSQEIFKMFMNQILSLKELKYLSTENLETVSNLSFIYFPGAMNCLKNLSVLDCSSDLYSEFFYQLSQSCHNIQSISIKFESKVSNGLKDLILSQNRLKVLNLTQTYYGGNWVDLIPSFIKHSNTLIKLNINGGKNHGPLSFISKLKRLRELFITFHYLSSFEDFIELRHEKFPDLRILKFPYGYPEHGCLTKFLEINGRDLKEFDVGDYSNSANSSIIKFCPNLQTLSTLILNGGLKSLEEIFMKCQQLESIKIWCGEYFLNEKESLEVVARCSPENFSELKIYYTCNVRSELLPEELESFFTSWTNRIPKNSISLILIKGYCANSLESKKENMRIIEKYINLGVIKKFETISEFPY